MTTALDVQKQRVTTIRDLLEKSKAQIAVALPKHLDPNRLLRIAMTTIQRNPKLLEADPRTLVGAIIQCSQLGLEPDSILGHAYLVPFWNGQLRRFDVQLIPGYRGLISLAKRSGEVRNIYSNIVWDGEPYVYEQGTNPKIQHTPMPPSARGTMKIAAYAVAVDPDGEKTFEWVWAEDIIKIRDRSLKSKKIDPATASPEDMGPWGTDEDEMWRKTAVRRLSKYLSLSPEFQKAANLDEIADAGVPQGLDKVAFAGDVDEIVSDEAAQIAAKTAEKAEGLREKLAEKGKKAGAPAVQEHQGPAEGKPEPEGPKDGPGPASETPQATLPGTKK